MAKRMNYTKAFSTEAMIPRVPTKI